MAKMWKSPYIIVIAVIILLVVILAVYRLANTGEPAPAAIKHPCLFFDTIADTPGWQNRGADPWKSYEAAIIDTANASLAKDYGNASWGYVQYRGQDAYYLGLAYQITGKAQYADKARDALLHIDYGDPQSKLNQAQGLGYYIKAYDWVQPSLDPASDSAIRDKLANMTDGVYQSLNHYQNPKGDRNYVAFDDYHGQAYATVFLSGLALADYTNPHELPLKSGPGDWVKCGTDYMFVNDSLHDFNEPLTAQQLDDTGSDLAGSYKSYYIDDFIWMAQAYTHFYGRNMLSDYPQLKSIFTAEARDALPSYYMNDYDTSGNDRWQYQAVLMNLFDADTRAYMLNYYDNVLNASNYPYSSVASGTDYPQYYLFLGNYSGMSRSTPPYTSYFNRSSILQVFRENWNMDSDWLSLVTYNVDTTHSNRNNAHDDQLSLEYYARGDLLLSDGGENRNYLNKDYGHFENDHNTIAVEDPRHPFNTSSWADSEARGIFKGKDTGLMTPVTIKELSQTPGMDAALANTTIWAVPGDTWDTYQTLTSNISYERDILYPVGGYFIVVDRLEGTQPWIYRTIFKPGTENIVPTTNSTNIGHVNGALSIGGAPCDWQSLPYTSETSTGITANSFAWNATNTYGNGVSLQVYSAPASEIRVLKTIDRIGGVNANDEVYAPVVYYRSPANDSLYRVTALISRYATESPLVPDTVPVSGDGNAIEVANASFTDYVYTGTGTSSFGPVTTDADTAYVRTGGQPDNYTLINGSFIDYAGTALLSSSSRLDYLSVAREGSATDLALNASAAMNIQLSQLSSAGSYRVTMDGQPYSNWERRGESSIALAVTPGEHTYRIAPLQ